MVKRAASADVAFSAIIMLNWIDYSKDIFLVPKSMHLNKSSISIQLAQAAYRSRHISLKPRNGNCEVTFPY
jgi:hypothetical protein